MKTFIREISADRLTDAIIKDYEMKGYRIDYKADSVEIWYDETLEAKAA